MSNVVARGPVIRHYLSMTNATTLDLGNNESVSRGVFEQADGTFTAMTFGESKNFKSRKGADNWFAKREVRRVNAQAFQQKISDRHAACARNTKPRWHSFLKNA